MELLPKDLLVDKIALELSPSDVLNLCLTVTRFSEIICNSDVFWRNKLLRDFNVRGDDPKSIYKRIYENKQYCAENYNPLESARSDVESTLILYKVPYLLSEQKIVIAEEKKRAF